MEGKTIPERCRKVGIKSSADLASRAGISHFIAISAWAGKEIEQEVKDQINVAIEVAEIAAEPSDKTEEPSILERWIQETPTGGFRIMINIPPGGLSDMKIGKHAVWLYRSLKAILSSRRPPPS